MDVRHPVPTNGGDWLTKYGEDWKSQIATIQKQFGSAIQEVRTPSDHFTDVPIIYVDKKKVLELLQFLKSESGFEYTFLADLTASDESPAEPRFEVIYNLYSPTRHWRIRVKTRVGEDQSVPTACSLWAGANWAEREAYDMYGVRFEGHPDLRRILNDVRFVGYPLRKDYPIKGYQIFPSAEEIDKKLLE